MAFTPFNENRIGDFLSKILRKEIDFANKVVEATGLEGKFEEYDKTVLSYAQGDVNITYVIGGHLVHDVSGCPYISIGEKISSEKFPLAYRFPIPGDIKRLIEIGSKYQQISEEVKKYSDSFYNPGFYNPNIKSWIVLNVIVDKDNFDAFTKFIGETGRFVIEEYKLSEEKAKQTREEIAKRKLEERKWETEHPSLLQ